MRSYSKGCLVVWLLVLSISIEKLQKVRATCEQLQSWTPSFPADFSEHLMQEQEDNWIMCNFHDAQGRDYGVNSFQVRQDYAALIAANFSSLLRVVPQAIHAILNCGCAPGPCLASAVSNVAVAVSAVAAQLRAVGNPLLTLQASALEAIVPTIQTAASALVNSSLNAARPFASEQVGQATGLVIPHVNPNAHYSYETSTSLQNVDMTVATQVPAVPVRYNGATFAYDQDAVDYTRFTFSFFALDWVTGGPISGQFQLHDNYGPLLWGPNNTGFYKIPYNDGSLDGWTQSDQPWLEAKGVINGGGTSTPVKGACWNSRQWHTSPSVSLSTTGPYLWLALVTDRGIAIQLATYYTNYSYSSEVSRGGGNIVYPVCEGDSGYNHSARYQVDINNRKCHAGPMQAIHHGEFSFTLSNLWASTHRTGLSYWQTVCVHSTLWQFDFCVQALVPDNEYDWNTAPSTAYSEAPAKILPGGRIGGHHAKSLMATIEHLKTG